MTEEKSIIIREGSSQSLYDPPHFLNFSHESLECLLAALRTGCLLSHETIDLCFKPVFDGFEFDVVVLVVLQFVDPFEYLIAHMQVLILTKHLELQFLQLLQVLSLQAVMFLHHLLVASQHFVGVAHHQESLILCKLLLETVHEGPALGIERLQPVLDLLQFLLPVGVLVLLGCRKIVLEFVP